MGHRLRRVARPCKNAFKCLVFRLQCLVSLLFLPQSADSRRLPGLASIAARKG